MLYLLLTGLTLKSLLATFLLGCATLLLITWYSFQKQKYWKQRGIPYVKPLPIIGSLMDVLKLPIQDMELQRYKKYGKIYGYFESSRPFLSVAEPDLIRQILVKDFHAFPTRRSFKIGDKIAEKMLSIVEGEDWKRIRTIVSPTFSTGKIKRMLGIFMECSQTLVENFKKFAEKGQPVDVKNIYSTFTMDMIASSAFSTKIDSHNDPNNEFVQTAKKVFAPTINWRFVIFLIMPFIVKFYPLNFFPPNVKEFFTNITLQIIEERKRTGQTRNDFLQLLIDSTKELSDDGKVDSNEKDDIAENYGKEEHNEMFKKNIYTKKNLTTDELIAQCIIFFIAGFDTTASTLSFASYNLALNPDIQEKLIKEVDDAVEENNGKLEYEAIQSMKYLDNVISETLRMYPPLARLERTANENYQLGDTGITISKGMMVTIPVYGMHRDPQLYPDPEKFDPDRFSPEERAKRNPYTYLPFGAGPRNCVAMRFGLLEVKICLAHVISHFRIKKCPETKVPLEFSIGQGLIRPKAIKLMLEPRKDAVKKL